MSLKIILQALSQVGDQEFRFPSRRNVSSVGEYLQYEAFPSLSLAALHLVWASDTQFAKSSWHGSGKFLAFLVYFFDWMHCGDP